MFLLSSVVGKRALRERRCYPFWSHTQARITQVRPPKRWHCSAAMFWACASDAALAQPFGPHVFFASIANAAQVLRKLVTTLQSLPMHCAFERRLAASGVTSSNA